jgi:hypothetical protein
MPNFIIKTHQKNAIYKGNQIYILNKGMNSGNGAKRNSPIQKNNNKALVKPQNEPFTNSFVILFQNDEDAETVYWLAYSLWKAKFWQQSLLGSVIPFLRIADFKKDFMSKVNEMLQEHELHKKQIQALRLLEQKEDQLKKNIVLISEMRTDILNRYHR